MTEVWSSTLRTPSTPFAATRKAFCSECERTPPVFVPLVSGLIVRLFGLQHFNTLFGFAFLSHQVGAFVGAWLGGLSFDLTGSYTMAWGSMVVIGTCAFLLQWFMDDQPRPTRNRSSGLTAPAAA